MKYILILLFSLNSLPVFSNEQVQSHLENYFLGFRNKDEQAIKKLVSDKYFKMLKKNNTLKKSFSMQSKKRPIEKLDYKIIKAAQTPNKFFANTKRKSEKEFDHYWYTLELKDNGFKITDMIMLEEHPH